VYKFVIFLFIFFILEPKRNGQINSKLQLSLSTRTATKLNEKGRIAGKVSNDLKGNNKVKKLD
jgi:hypothetical protein